MHHRELPSCAGRGDQFCVARQLFRTQAWFLVRFRGVFVECILTAPEWVSTVQRMTDNQKGTIALVAGSIAGIITMALHPTGNDLTASGGHFAFVAWLTAAVHVLGIVSLPAMFLGGLALSQCLASKNRLSLPRWIAWGCPGCRDDRCDSERFCSAFGRPIAGQHVANRK